MSFFDPDRRLFSKDKVQHFAGAAFIMLLALVVVPFVEALLPPPLRALALIFVIAATFEAGQWDAVRGTEYLGRPGYGFGLLDLVVGMVGALVVLGVYAAVVAR